MTGTVAVGDLVSRDGVFYEVVELRPQLDHVLVVATATMDGAALTEIHVRAADLTAGGALRDTPIWRA